MSSVGSAQRTGHVADRVAHLEDAEVAAGLADGLDDERDRARLGVGVRDRQRDALGALGAAHDDELPGLADLGDAGGLDDEPRDVGGEDRCASTTGCIGHGRGAPAEMHTVEGTHSGGPKVTAWSRPVAGREAAPRPVHCEP